MDREIHRRDWLASGVLSGAAALLARPLLAEEQVSCSARPLAQDYTVVYRNRDPQFYVEGSGLVRLDDGVLVAVVPVVPRAEWTKELRASRSQTHVVRSRDGGKTWQVLSSLPYYSACPWSHGGRLYLFAFTPGAKKRNDDLHLLASGDGGQTWSKPVTLFRGHFWNCATAMVLREGRIYWTFDDIEKGTIHQRMPRVIAGDLSADLLDPRAWRLSRGVAFPGVPAELSNPKLAKLDDRFLEPNLIDVQGRLRVIASVKADSQSTANLCAVLDVHDDGQKLELEFVQFHPMPGGHLKFCILWDDASKLFWATANLSVDTQESYGWWAEGRKRGNFRPNSTGGDDRRLLMLLYGLDGLNWFQAGCVAQAKKISQSFMYARPVIDGDDLAIIARSSVQAANQHDADTATFHRVRNFRRLALHLAPEPE